MINLKRTYTGISIKSNWTWALLISRNFLYAIFILVSFSILNPASGKELVGIVPFTSQRDNPADNWLGFYIQARMQSFLANGNECNFHSLNTIRMWQFSSELSSPISIQNTLLITGSYQVVLDQGIVEIHVERFSPHSISKTFEISFAVEELESKLDQLFSLIYKWVFPRSNLKRSFEYPPHNKKGIRDIFQFRELLFNPISKPEIHHIDHIRDLIDSEDLAEFVSDLAEGMIIVSTELLAKERKVLLEETERLLRSAAMKHFKSSRILSLLAETYYLNKKENAWVKKTAKQANDLDSYNDLALLLQILSNSEQNDQVNLILKKLNDVNPWIWPDETEERNKAHFQKGIYKSELLMLQESLK